MDIPVVQARSIYTKALVKLYRENPRPTAFLRSFFNESEYGTKEIAIEVQRGTEKVAVDVERGTEGNRNAWSKSTEKIFVPPYFREFFDATQLDVYDRMFNASGIVSEDQVADFISTVAAKLAQLQDKIDRAYEKQCAQVFETGIITLSGGTSIDFKRDADSIVDLGGGGYWTGASVKPTDSLETGANFLRQKGKVQGGNINIICGSEALGALLDNTKQKARADIRNFSLDAIRAPQRNSVGATLHGEVSFGSYKGNIWSYPEFYDVNGTSTPYVNPKKVIMLPEATNFELSFAAVPQLISGGIQRTKGKYIVGEYIDDRKVAHIFDIKSAGVAIPVAVDQIYTMQVVA